MPERTDEAIADRDPDVERLVSYIATGLVDNPDDVSVEKVESERNVTFEIRVHADDVGKVIGRNGRIIKAIRVIARAAGILEGKQVHVDVPD